MALPFFSNRSNKRDQIVAVDLGGRTTKAVQLQCKGDSVLLQRYAILDAPIYEKSLSPELLGEHLRSVCQTLESKARLVTLAISVADSVVRHAELPLITLPDMRQVIKNNPKNYLQQDLPGHVFDCHIIPPRQTARTAEAAKTGSGPARHKVLVGGARQQLVDDLTAACKDANMAADQIVPGLVCPANAFERALPEIFHKEVIALVDVGFKNTTICVFIEGDLVLSRVVGIGGDRLTTGLAESLNVSYAEAEGIKIGMPTEVQSSLESLLAPLGRELRASIDFFENQHDRAVSQIYISGGSARSDFIINTLAADLIAPCMNWNPTGFLQMSLPAQQMADIDHVAPQLAVAVGAAVANF